MLQTADIKSVERAAQSIDGGTAIGPVDGQFGDHRVVVDGDLGAFIDPVIDPHAVAGWRQITHQPAGRRQEAACRILGINAGFDRPAVEPDILLGKRQLFARGNAQHQLDEIEPGHQFGDRMLDLQPCVHLEEVEISPAIDDKLHGPGRAVSDSLRQCHRLPSHRLARRHVEKRARRLLDHFLVAALDRALALAEIDDVAVGVAEHLDFDMPRLFDVLLNEDAIIAKARFCFARCTAEAVADLIVIGGDAHALAAAAGGGLDHDRVADIASDADRGIAVGYDIEITGDGRDAGGTGQLFRLDLVAHRHDRVRSRTDKDDPGLLQRRRECRVFREKTVAGMHRLGAGAATGLDNPVDTQVTVGRWWRSDPYRLVGGPDMRRLFIGIGVDRNRRDPHTPRRADDPAGDLAAISDQNFLKH